MGWKRILEPKLLSINQRVDLLSLFFFCGYPNNTTNVLCPFTGPRQYLVTNEMFTISSDDSFEGQCVSCSKGTWWHMMGEIRKPEHRWSPWPWPRPVSPVAVFHPGQGQKRWNWTGVIRVWPSTVEGFPDSVTVFLNGHVNDTKPLVTWRETQCFSNTTDLKNGYCVKWNTHIFIGESSTISTWPFDIFEVTVRDAVKWEP